jgi:hypothetical protein
MENPTFITFAKILFHFVTTISKKIHALIVSRLATCFSFLALISAKISSCSNLVGVICGLGPIAHWN